MSIKRHQRSIPSIIISITIDVVKKNEREDAYEGKEAVKLRKKKNVSKG